MKRRTHLTFLVIGCAFVGVLLAAVFAPSTALAADSGQQDMYRMYNPNSGEHFYTASVAEKNNLVSVGWRYEGVGWVAPQTSDTPVYRLYNPNAGDHHYTTSAAERDHLVSVGWRYEGIGWYSSDAQTLAVLRQYNPNARAGAHNFTTSQAENDHLVSVGWRAEGIGWYALGEGQASASYVYVDAGHGWEDGKWDSGALGGGYQEANETRELANLVVKYVQEQGVNCYTNANSTQQTGLKYSKRQADAQGRGCTILVSIHFNAGGGTGIESYIHSLRAPAGSATIQSTLMKHLEAAYGGTLRNRGSKQAQLAVTSTYVPATLLEICFIDNPYDMSVYKAREDAVAREIAAGIVECTNQGF